eukprot:TRINITY_DN51478_c0_g1_i1.p1 TRINITY_DN51478_c0_g1~~TRINITY_DN51478_c0_g1_i1.p1  ORF type:complete len:615 (-),score=102.14 TRINITY_DN51478_c0_g1_i1:94-1938(-)
MACFTTKFLTAACPCLGSARDTSFISGEGGPVATLSTGRIIGEYLPSGVQHFSGVPFAAPPTGERRWLRPAALQSWQGELDCSSRRPANERRGRPVQQLDDADTTDRPPTEDCLYLDIWLPKGTLSNKDSNEEKRKSAPVLIWIYGGGLLGGAKDDRGSSGEEYAERGIIYLTINYRVGALGFLRPRGGDANCGLWDQVAALRWVQQEIGSFGGDSGQVTIMGQSAGGDSVYWLCASPIANRLFSRAIMMSPASFTTSPGQAEELAEEFATRAGAQSADLADMQKLSVEAILDTQNSGRFRAHPTTGPGWRELMAGGTLPQVDPEPCPTASGIFQFPNGTEPPGWPMPVAVVDGELLEYPPLVALARGVASHIDIIVGGNRHENGFKPHSDAEAQKPHPQCFGRFVPADEPREELVRRLSWEIAGAPAVLHSPSDELKQTVRSEIIPAYLAELEASGSRAEPQALHDAIATDFSFLAKVHLIADRLAKRNNSKSIYRYQFNGFGERGEAFHATELEMLMGVPGDGLERFGLPKVRTQWMDSWAAFAHTGNPNIPEMTGAWKPYNLTSSHIMTWDGENGWKVDEEILEARSGLKATAKLWERLWMVDEVSTCSMS